jgi:hypothetical protein
MEKEDSQVKERELARRASKLVYKTASKIAAEYGAEIVIGNL